DRAGDLARRIRRVVEARMLHRVSDAEIRNARLGDDAAILEIDLEDPVELAETEQDAIGERQRPARKRRARTARHDLDAILAAVAQDLRDLPGRTRQHDDERRLPI